MLELPYLYQFYIVSISTLMDMINLYVQYYDCKARHCTSIVHLHTWQWQSMRVGGNGRRVEQGWQGGIPHTGHTGHSAGVAVIKATGKNLLRKKDNTCKVFKRVFIYAHRTDKFNSEREFLSELNILIKYLFKKIFND